MLTHEPENLLERLGEGWRFLPKDSRSQFLVVPYDGRGSQLPIVLPNPSKFQLSAYEGDVLTLIEGGLLRPDYGRHGLRSLDLTNAAFNAYEEIKRRRGALAGNVENSIRQYLDDCVSGRYSHAHTKAVEAEQLLWGDDSERSLTTRERLWYSYSRALFDFMLKEAGYAAGTSTSESPESTLGR